LLNFRQDVKPGYEPEDRGTLGKMGSDAPLPITFPSPVLLRRPMIRGGEGGGCRED